LDHYAVIHVATTTTAENQKLNIHVGWEIFNIATTFAKTGMNNSLVTKS
jgi:hypothetical protein